MDSKGSSAEMDMNDILVEQFKIKKLIKFLMNSKGNQTSMISLIARPGEQIPKIQKMLEQEFGTAANIKSRLNRQSVQTAIVSTKERLKLYNRVPKNGLCIFCGEILMEDNRTMKKYVIDFEPYKPINKSLYRCLGKFVTEPLEELLEDNEKFGFIIVDGSGTLFGRVQGNAREVLYKFSVDLPKKHRKGGQSSVRFSRLREESRHNYVRKVCEFSTQMFITNDAPNVTGLVLAGFADFKTVISESDLFDQRLKPKIVELVDVTYGMETGFKEAIEKSAEALGNVRFMQEKKIINRFFKEIAMDTGMVVFGIEDTMAALEHSALETLMVCESIELNRYEIVDPSNPEDKSVYFLTEKQAEDPKYYKNPNSETEKEVVD